MKDIIPYDPLCEVTTHIFTDLTRNDIVGVFVFKNDGTIAPIWNSQCGYGSGNTINVYTNKIASD